MLLKDEEIAKLKLKSQYEDDDWQVPAFVLKAKEVCLPKVNGRQVMEREKDEREMEVLTQPVLSDGVDGGGSRSTGDSEDDTPEQQQFKQSQFKSTNKDTGTAFNTQQSKNSAIKGANASKKDGQYSFMQQSSNGSTAHLRKSGLDNPFDSTKENAPLVKNHKVNAQLAPIESSS